MRIRTVAAGAGDPAFEAIDGGGAAAATQLDRTCGCGRIDVQRDRMIDAVERAIIDHHRCAALMLAASTLLSGLKQEAYLATQLAARKFGLKQMRDTQQDRGVRIVTTGVHRTSRLGSERDIDILDNRQRVHVGANADHWPIAIADFTDHAGDADTGTNLDTANFAQRIGHQLRGANFLKCQLGMRVDLAAEPNDLALEGTGFV